MLKLHFRPRRVGSEPSCEPVRRDILRKWQTVHTYLMSMAGVMQFALPPLYEGRDRRRIKDSGHVGTVCPRLIMGKPCQNARRCLGHPARQHTLYHLRSAIKIAAPITGICSYCLTRSCRLDDRSRFYLYRQERRRMRQDWDDQHRKCCQHNIP